MLYKKITPLLIVSSFLFLVSLFNFYLGYGGFINAQTTTSTQAIMVAEEQAVVNVVKSASPAVVSIVATAEVPKMQNCRGMEGMPPEFQQYMPQMCEQKMTQRDIGSGSGFLVSSDGYILTNKHVVQNTRAEYTVILNDEKNLGKKVKATVVARDPNNDIAVIKIDMKDLPFLSFGDSTSLQVGQTAIAIGYSLGEFDNTVSKGVISGLSRSINASDAENFSVERLRGLIQTDAAINPGNSGGPLLDVNGKVVGMNVAMAEAQSIGFAIPSNAVKNDYEQVRTTGKITATEKAYLGVRYIPINTEVKSTYNLTYNYGMYVHGVNKDGVIAGSPAEKSGLKEGDIILEADGRQLNERYVLSDVVESHKPGDVIKLKIYSDGREKEINTTLGKIQT